MPRNITVTLANGQTHVYNNAPDDITPEQVTARAQKDFGQAVTALDGGRSAASSPARQVAKFSSASRPAASNALAEAERSFTDSMARKGITGPALATALDKFRADPRYAALASRAGKPIPAPSTAPTKAQRIARTAQASADQNASGAGNFLTALSGGITRGLFGIPERLAAAGERFLPSAITGNTTNASYDDILQLVRANTDADMGKSTAGAVAGQLIGGLGATRAAAGLVGNVAGRAAGAASPIVSRAGNVIQNAMTLRKGQTVANAGKVILGGAAGGAAQGTGDGSGTVKGAVEGAAGAAALGGGFKAAQVLTRPIRDVLRLSNAGTILSRLTSATSDQLATRAQAYRDATGAEPTLFELLPLADRNKILKSAIVGRDNVVEATSGAIRRRAGNLGPEMSARARAALEPARTRIEQNLVNDLTTARGGTADPGDAALARRAASSPTDMAELRDVEARAIMAPHENSPVAESFGEILPQVPQNDNGTISMVDADPAVSAAIRSAVPGGFRAPDQGVTAGDVSDMIQTLRGDLSKGGIEGRTAQRAIDHLEGVLSNNAPDAAAAHQQMTNAYAARSRMMEGMQEGNATRLRDDVQVGTNRRTARQVRNAYDSAEGVDGRSLGQGNRILSDLGGSPEEALRETVRMARGNTTRQLAQNVGVEPAETIAAAARAQDESAQALASAAQRASGGGGEELDASGIAHALAGLSPHTFLATKAGALKRLLSMSAIPENRARTMVDMIFSQNPDMARRAIAAVGNAPNGARFLNGLAADVGALSGSASPAPDPNAPADVDTAPEAQEPVSADVASGEQPAEAPAADVPVDEASSPYAGNLQEIYDNESPELLALIDRVQAQESGGRQHDDNGQPITSRAGAIGTMQVMPATAPEAASLAGVPFDENAYRNDPAYNKLLGIAYLSELLRRYDGDVAKATAAYNAGAGRVDDAVKSHGDNWIAAVPGETQQYVQKVA